MSVTMGPRRAIYTKSWRMSSPSSIAFGPTVTVSIVVPQPTLVDNAQLSSESVPPNTQEPANASFTEVVAMLNTTTTTWIAGPNADTLNRSGTAQFGESTFYTTLDQASV